MAEGLGEKGLVRGELLRGDPIAPFLVGTRAMCEQLERACEVSGGGAIQSVAQEPTCLASWCHSCNLG